VRLFRIEHLANTSYSVVKEFATHGAAAFLLVR